jgi:hypothetical protein
MTMKVSVCNMTLFIKQNKYSHASFYAVEAFLKNTSEIRNV